ncbi:MAG TPA: hypothetical protein VD884_05820 [Ohtaekwangia sp.]|nr:hypothetical protein [Ohtaekwangia sp.]
MKKLLFALCFMFGAAVAVQAQDTTSTQYQNDAMTQDQSEDRDKGDKQSIAISELPATVTSSLETSDYSGWQINNAYKKEKGGETFYAVELKQGNETKMVKFDAQGNKVKEKDKDKK